MVAAFFEKCRTCGTDIGGLLETVVRFEMELRATLTGQQKALLEQFEKAAFRSLDKADIIPYTYGA